MSLLSFWGQAERLGLAGDVAARLSEAEAERASTLAGTAERASADRLVAKLLLCSGDAAGALTAAEAAYLWWRREHDLLHPDCATMRTMVGQALLQLDRLADAEALEREVVDEADRRGDSGVVAAVARSNLGNCLMLQGREREAEPHFRRALDQLGDAPAERGIGRNNLSALLSNMGRFAEADSELALSIEELNEALGPDDPTTRQARLQLAIARATAGKGLNALAALGDTDKRMAAALGPEHPTTLLARAVRSMIDNALGRAQGRVDAQHVLGRLHALLGPEHHLVRYADRLLLDVIEGNAFTENDSGSELLSKTIRMARRASDRGDHGRALSLLGAHIEVCDEQGATAASLIARRLEIEALFRAGYTDALGAKLERARELAEQLGDPAQIAEFDAAKFGYQRLRPDSLDLALRGRVMAAQAVVSGNGPSSSEPGKALLELHAIVEEAEQAGLWIPAVLARIVLGKVYQQIDMRPVGTRHLLQAKELAERAGATDLCAKIDALLA